MKRIDMILIIKETLQKIPAKKDGSYSDFDCDLLLTELEKVGIMPPSVRVSTPLGPRIFYTINEWEENVNVNIAGELMDDPDRDKTLPKAGIIK